MADSETEWNFRLRAGRFNRLYPYLKRDILQSLASKAQVSIEFTYIRQSVVERHLEGNVKGSPSAIVAFSDEFERTFH